MQQDIHSIVGARFDRRIRPHGHPQALKCPRCDSLNTKFCYYNNYNLSQPRHFCKNCRRYWTKGGVLRNVPVGGGCRKSKRSKQKSERKSNQSSSSDSSSLTAAATSSAPATAPAPAPPVPAAEEGAVPDQPAATNSTTANNLPDPSRIFNPPALDQQEPNSQMFGSYTNLMTSQEEMLGFGMGNRGSEFKGGSEDGLAALEWADGGVGGGGGGGDEGLFDLTGGIDSGSYWSQTEWTDNDQSLNNYIP